MTKRPAIMQQLKFFPISPFALALRTNNSTQVEAQEAKLWRRSFLRVCIANIAKRDNNQAVPLFCLSH